MQKTDYELEQAQRESEAHVIVLTVTPAALATIQAPATREDDDFTSEISPPKCGPSPGTTWQDFIQQVPTFLEDKRNADFRELICPTQLNTPT